MADPIDPDKLMSLADLAKRHGYNAQHFTRLAQVGKIQAWHIGNTWITTDDFVKAYIKSAPPPGRRRKSSTKNGKQ